MVKYKIYKSDIVQWLEWYISEIKEGREKPFNAVLSDPPYFLDTIVKRFGKKDAAPAKFGTDGVFSRSSKNFMGKTWDSFDSPQHYQSWITEWARLLKDVLYPGAVGLFYGGSRTFHRLACGIEDAGWEIEDEISVIDWVYGSGMPHGYNYKKGMAKSNNKSIRDIANLWNGYNTALKPSHEPILVARVPRGKKTYIQCAIEYGSGALNIEDSSIPVKGSNTKRYPSNFVLFHHPDCDDEKCHSLCPVAELNKQSGYKKQSGSLTGKEPSRKSGLIYNGYNREGWTSHKDEGGASRFFYVSKPSLWEKSFGLDTKLTHPTSKPLKLNEYLSRMLLTPNTGNDRRLLVPFSGVASEMIGGLLAGWDYVAGIEKDEDNEYIPQGEKRLAAWAQFSSYDEAYRHYKKSSKEK